jgi:hypothetical protein
MAAWSYFLRVFQLSVEILKIYSIRVMITAIIYICVCVFVRFQVEFGHTCVLCVGRTSFPPVCVVNGISFVVYSPVVTLRLRCRLGWGCL